MKKIAFIFLVVLVIGFYPRNSQATIITFAFQGDLEVWDSVLLDGTVQGQFSYNSNETPFSSNGSLAFYDLHSWNLKVDSDNLSDFHFLTNNSLAQMTVRSSGSIDLDFCGDIDGTVGNGIPCLELSFLFLNNDISTPPAPHEWGAFISGGPSEYDIGPDQDHVINGRLIGRAVPEPTTMLLFTTGLVGAYLRRRQS